MFHLVGSFHLLRPDIIHNKDVTHDCQQQNALDGTKPENCQIVSNGRRIKAMARKPPKDPSMMTLAELKRCMTAKQLKFAQALATEGISKTEAFRRAYDTSGYGSQMAISVDASRTAASPKVVHAVDLIRETYNIPALRDAASTRAFVLKTLHELATTAEKESDRLQAALALGKTSHVGLFVDRKEVVHRQAGPDTAADVLQRLQAIAAQVAASREAERQVIDVTPEPARLPEPADSDLPDGE